MEPRPAGRQTKRQLRRHTAQCIEVFLLHFKFDYFQQNKIKDCVCCSEQYWFRVVEPSHTSKTGRNKNSKKIQPKTVPIVCTRTELRYMIYMYSMYTHLAMHCVVDVFVLSRIQSVIAISSVCTHN